jgi:hypothetical protein
VVTVATTNDPSAIDAAAKRAARFDRLVEVPPPDTAGRAAILTRYLRGLPGPADVNVRRVAAATDGATGADLNELVTLAVLHASRCAGDDGAMTTDLLLRLAAEAGYHLPTGQYLEAALPCSPGQDRLPCSGLGGVGAATAVQRQQTPGVGSLPTGSPALDSRNFDPDQYTVCWDLNVLASRNTSTSVSYGLPRPSTPRTTRTRPPT